MATSEIINKRIASILLAGICHPTCNERGKEMKYLRLVLKSIVLIGFAMIVAACPGDGGGKPPPNPCDAKPCPDLEVSINWIEGVRTGVFATVTNRGTAAPNSSVTLTANFSGPGDQQNVSAFIRPDQLAPGTSRVWDMGVAWKGYFPPNRLYVAVSLFGDEPDTNKNALSCGWPEGGIGWICSYSSANVVAQVDTSIVDPDVKTRN